MSSPTSPPAVGKDLGDDGDNMSSPTSPGGQGGAGKHIGDDGDDMSSPTSPGTLARSRDIPVVPDVVPDVIPDVVPDVVPVVPDDIPGKISPPKNFPFKKHSCYTALLKIKQFTRKIKRRISIELEYMEIGKETLAQYDRYVRNRDAKNIVTL